MQRRAVFNKILSPSKSNRDQSLASPPAGGFQKYEGEWTMVQAAHLLRRTLFGFDYSQLKSVTEYGLDEAIQTLMEELPAAPPPLNYDFESDPDVPLGETWVGAPYDLVNNSNAYRVRSIKGWTMSRLLSKELNIREKMTLFWHNHFVTSDINEARFKYIYIDLFRSDPLPNFRDLVKKVTIDPSMLRYLDGRTNTVRSPNENYGRELLELFTIGKGPQVAPGDYTFYTEEDVRAISRALTGWVDFGYRNVNNPNIGAQFFPNRHDKDDKVLSHRFNNAVISDEGDQEYKTLIDIIFEQEEVSKFISRKLYRWFVFYKIDDTVEQEIIEPMAKMIRDNDYSIKEALTALLSSDHFYDLTQRGCMIKNPIDFVTSLIKNIEMKDPPEELSVQYTYWLRTFNGFRNMQMEYFTPPNVAGWKAYYQEPSYYQVWLNAVTLPLRQAFSDLRVTRGVTIQGNQLKGDYLTMISRFDNPYDVNEVINSLIAVMLPRPVSGKQFDALKAILLPGLPDFEWTVEYGDHILNPDDNALKTALENKLRDLLIYITRMPEYQLS